MLKVLFLILLVICILCFYKCLKYRKKTLELIIVKDPLRVDTYTALHTLSVWVGIFSGLMLGLLVGQLF